MSSKSKSLTYLEAINLYFGGVHKLNHQSLPFTCTCGSSQYPEDHEDDIGIKITINLPIMSVDDCVRHIRRFHKERIR